VAHDWIFVWQPTIDGHLELTNATRSQAPFHIEPFALHPLLNGYSPIGFFYRYAVAYTTHLLDGKE